MEYLCNLEQANLTFLIVFYSNFDQPFPSTYTHLLLGTTTQMETTVLWFMTTCKITVLLHLDESLHLLMQVAEQHVMLDTGLKNKFFDALTCLGIKISPSIRCDLLNRLLRKIYNIRCNEFVQSQKCLEEHSDKQTQDRLVML